MRSRVALTTIALTGTMVVLPSAVEAATVSTPQVLAACPTDVAADPAGAVRLLTRTQAKGRWSVAAPAVDPAGTIVPGLSASRAWKRPNAVRSVFSGDGVAVAFESGQVQLDPERGIALAARAKKKEPTVSATIVGPGGASAPQVVSDPHREAELAGITSRGGTTVVHFRQSVPGKLWLQDWVAVRAAGAARFAKAVSLKSSIRDRFSTDDVYLGPDGSGVVVSVPSEAKQPVSARRITTDGRVGRAIPFGTRPADIADATAAVGPTGQIIVAVVDTAKPRSYGRAGLFIAELSPGAAGFSEPKLAGTARYDTGLVGDALALAIDAAGHVSATIGRTFEEGTRDVYAPGFETFSGAGDQLVRGPDVDGILSVGDTPVITPTADGSVALTWEGDELVGSGDDFNRSQHVSFRAADGTWSAPATISPPFLWTAGSFALNRGSAALPGGGLAMAYSIERPGKKTVCSLVRVTP